MIQEFSSWFVSDFHKKGDGKTIVTKELIQNKNPMTYSDYNHSDTRFIFDVFDICIWVPYTMAHDLLLHQNVAWYTL